MNSRVLGVNIPILGASMDINDLSLMAGLSFSILLSWFQFSLRRQHDNVKKLFEIAKEHGELSTAYDLLAMTQVLTVPPARNANSPAFSFARRLSRLPSLILWTSVIAQGVVLGNDVETMQHGDILAPHVSTIETCLAFVLFAYMIIRTSQCFKMMSETYEQWKEACEESSPKKSSTPLTPQAQGATV